MYSEKVMEHFSNPRNVGELEDANAVGQVGNPKCGDIMKIYMKIEDDTIKDIKFKTFGCGAAIATSSMATEMVKGKTIEEALQLTNKAVAEAARCWPRKASNPPLPIITSGRASIRSRLSAVPATVTAVTDTEQIHYYIIRGRS